jgi:hypothetical protein
MSRSLRAIVLLAHVVGACASSGSPAPQGPDSVGQTNGEARAPQEPGEQPTPEEVAESEAVARQVLGERPGGARKTAASEWLTTGKLYWVMGPTEPARLVGVVGGGRRPILLTGDIAALKEFVAMQFNGRLPGVDALNGIAQLVKDAVIGRDGSIDTPGIRRSLKKNEWTLEFNVTKSSGAVDVVRASGTASPLMLEHVSVGVVKPRG